MNVDSMALLLSQKEPPHQSDYLYKLIVKTYKYGFHYQNLGGYESLK